MGFRIKKRVMHTIPGAKLAATFMVYHAVWKSFWRTETTNSGGKNNGYVPNMRREKWSNVYGSRKRNIICMKTPRMLAIIIIWIFPRKRSGMRNSKNTVARAPYRMRKSCFLNRQILFETRVSEKKSRYFRNGCCSWI
jgi:hypothetical protein